MVIQKNGKQVVGTHLILINKRWGKKFPLFLKIIPRNVMTLEKKAVIYLENNKL